MTKYYAGVGSRQTPPHICKQFTEIARNLDPHYTLRSGGAIGADKAFEAGATNKEIFLSHHAQPWAFKEVLRHFPSDRNPKNFATWNSYTQGLLARNMMQVLGFDGKTPVDFVICWTPMEDPTTSLVGGTGYAIRCALAHTIPVFNFNNIADIERFNKCLT